MNYFSEKYGSIVFFYKLGLLKVIIHFCRLVVEINIIDIHGFVWRKN